ncbi:hypothetical protein C8R46DRAFT_1346213 [Mycena filopes]|nr:hypothetical protein C8R46DRAFT_1346213 [Mycena filopes]
MDPTANSELSELRRRLAAIESDLQVAQRAREEAEAELENHRTEAKNALHAHHAARNLASYGHSAAGITFVRPEDQDQGVIYRLAKGQGPRASACRLIVRYNLDQFFQRPRLHQWLAAGKLYREAGEQLSSRFELFFDLLFVGLVHQISDAAAEQPTGIGFAKYVLTFAPAFSVWSDVRDIANQYANDDVTQRAYILWIMMLLVGYANNAGAIEFGVAEGGGEEEGGSLITEDSLTSVRWTLGFFVVAKLSRVIISLIYAVFLPLSRRPLIVSTCNALILAIIFTIAIFTSLHVTIALVALTIVLDHALRVFGVLLYKTMEILGRRYEKRRRLHSRQNSGPWTLEVDDGEKNEQPISANSSVTAVNEDAPLGGFKMCQRTAAHRELRFPAINIEHHVERLGAFVTIVLGEMVVSVFFKASGTVGLNRESGRAFLSLMIAFNLNWLYFGSQACKHFVHAIRRHWLSGFLFTTLHLPLCLSLLLASSAINRLVTSSTMDSELGGGLKWFFGAGLGASVCMMATIGVLHKNLDDMDGVAERIDRSANAIRRTISRRVVLGIRYLAGLAMILVPIVDDLTSIQFLGIYAAITVFLIIEETIARIEKREQQLDEAESSRSQDGVA